MPRPSRPQEELDDECRQVGHLIRIENKSYFEAAEIVGISPRQVRVYLDRYDKLVALTNLHQSIEQAYSIQLENINAIQKQAWENNQVLQEVLQLLNPTKSGGGESETKATEQEIAESIEELIGANPELSPILKKTRQVKKRHNYAAFFKAMELSQKNHALLIKITEEKNKLLGLTKDPQIAIVQNEEAIALRYYEAAESKYHQLKSAQPIDEINEIPEEYEDGDL